MFSKSWEEHSEHLKLVFATLKQNKLVVKESKCEIGLKKIEFLGYKISSSGIEVSPEKVRAIRNMKPLKNVTEVRSFLGMCGFYRKFVPNFSTICASLTELLKDNVQFEWSAKQQVAFDTIKAKLLTSPILKMPDFQRDFIVQCDASGVGIGGVLLQKFDTELPIAYESRKLTPAEANYPVHELELLAIIHCLKVWRCYLEGKKVVVRTDHASLRFIKTQKNLSRRVCRWIELMQNFDLEIQYVPGKTNVIADALSRLEVNTVADEDWPQLYHQYFNKEPVPERFEKMLENERNHYSIDNGVIYFQHPENGKVPYIPFSYRADLVWKQHHGIGHLAGESTYNVVKERGYWPGMKKDILEWVKTCVICQKCNERNGNDKRNSQEMQLMPSMQPFERWSLDFIGRLPVTKAGNKFIITAIDHCTRWPIAKAVSVAGAATVGKFIYEEILLNFGCPKEILTDQAKCFSDQVLQEYLEKQLVKHLRTTAYHPRTNGLVERLNGILGSMIRKFVENGGQEWDVYLNQALFACRVRVHRSIGVSPFYLTYGISPTLPGDYISPFITNEKISIEELEKWREGELQKLSLERQKAKEREENIRKENKKNFDRKLKNTSFQINDLVLLKNEARTKFDPFFKGPFTVAEESSNKALVKLCHRNGEPLPNWINKERLVRITVGKNIENDGYNSQI